MAAMGTDGGRDGALKCKIRFSRARALSRVLGTGVGLAYSGSEQFSCGDNVRACLKLAQCSFLARDSARFNWSTVASGLPL